MKSLYLAFLISFSATAAESIEFVETLAGRRATGYLGTGGGALGLPYGEPEVGDFPESFDWRSQGVELPSVKDQGSCGSCWSFAITSALESALSIFGGEPGLNLSEQHAVSCDAKSYGCNGGFMDSAAFWVKGITDEASFPYKARDVSCRRGLPVKGKASSFTLLGGLGKRPTADEIKSALVKHGPLFITVMAGGAGWSGGGPRVTSCRKRGGTNHMINLVGYTKTDWIIKNSWGASWGEKGYAKIGIGCDFVADEAGYVTVGE